MQKIGRIFSGREDAARFRVAIFDGRVTQVLLYAAEGSKRLKVDSAGELPISGAVALAAHCAEGAAGGIGVDSAEVNGICNIESFSIEDEVGSLREMECTAESGVDVVAAGTEKAIGGSASYVADLQGVGIIGGGKRVRFHERESIRVCMGYSISPVAVLANTAGESRSIIGETSALADRRTPARLNLDRASAAVICNPGKRPSARHPAYSVVAASELTFAKRQVVHTVEMPILWCAFLGAVDTILFPGPAGSNHVGRYVVTAANVTGVIE